MPNMFMFNLDAEKCVAAVRVPDGTGSQRGRAADVLSDGLLGIVVAPARVGVQRDEISPLRPSNGAERIAEAALAAAVAKGHPVPDARAGGRGPARVGHPYAVSAHCGQLVTRPAAPPAGAEPRGAHGVELRLPRGVVSQGGQRRLEGLVV